MNTSEEKTSVSVPEINLRQLISRAWKRKWWIAASVLLFVGLAFLYLKTKSPVYEVSSSLLIDTSGENRKLGENKYLEGGAGQVEIEKNVYNELILLQSYDLVKQAVRELDFGVSYYAGNQLRLDEMYHYFPFKVVAPDSNTQMVYAPFEVELLADDAFRLKVETESYGILKPGEEGSQWVESDFSFEGRYKFGEWVEHDLFKFKLEPPDYPVDAAGFRDKKLAFELKDIEGLTGEYMGGLRVDQVDMLGSVILLTSQGSVVEKEVKFLKKLTDKYIEQKLKDRDEIALSKEAFIRQQLDNISDSLARAERNIEAFRRNSQAINLSETATITLGKIQDLESRKAQMRLNLEYYQSLLDYLTDSASINQIVAPSVVGISDPLLNENLLELKKLYAQKTETVFYKGEKSYDLDILDQQIAATTQALQENIRNLIQSSQMTIANLENQVQDLDGVLNRLPSSEKLLASYERKSKLYEELFNYLSQELAKAGIARAEDIPDTRVVDAPRMVGNGPVAPPKKLILILGFMAGLLLPLTGIVLFDLNDDTIETLQQIERTTNIPVVASIAQDSEGKKKGSFFESDTIIDWRAQESFRDLSARLQFLVNDDQNKVIGLTSTLPGEGKTYCAINLGKVFAEGGKKVIYIDTDLRKPSVFKGFKLDEGFPMLSDYLGDEEVAIHEIIQVHPKFPSLHYIPSTIEGKSLHQLLGNGRFQVLIQKLKNNYDYILIDAPAIGLVSDYLLVANDIDIHLMVLRRNLSKVSFIKDLERLKARGRLRDVYFIFNGAVGKSFKYGYSEYRY